MNNENSRLNLFAMSSVISTTRPISSNFNCRVVNDIIDDIFLERRGTWDVSSSQCSSIRLKPSEYSYDKRLKYWKDVLKDRQMLEKKITEKTSKKPGDILYKRMATIDERDKQTVKTILDYAERMNPIKLMTRPISMLPEKCIPETQQHMHELRATLPKAERDQCKFVEISGVPKAVRIEMLGKPKYQGEEKPSSWLKSKVLESKVEEKLEDIQRVLEYYPDIENLQVVGEGLNKVEIPQRDSDIQLLKRDQLCEISSESKEGETKCIQEIAPAEVPTTLAYAFKINDTVFIVKKKGRSKIITIDINFTALPYEREVKKMMTVQNIGEKVLNFEWSHRAYYAKNSTLLKNIDNEFVFDNHPFRLYKAQSKEIEVLYQPRKVDIVKARWVLKVDPCCFSRRNDGIVVRLAGTCLPPPEYTNKLNKIQREVIEKSNLKMMRQLTSGLGAITPKIEPPEAICPYQRTLNDMELFEQLNVGFKCERYHDLQLLNDLYNRVKKPREKIWDLKVNSLKEAVLRIPSPESRALYFNEFTQILDGMKGPAPELDQRLSMNPEKDKSRLVYVKGMLSSCLDEWGELSINLEDSFYKPALDLFLGELEQLKMAQKENPPDDHLEEDDDEEDLFALLENESFMQLYVLEKRVRCLKAFRDCLYMQTYTIVCNLAENIVNIIESTEAI